jgi:hypothetical protein
MFQTTRFLLALLFLCGPLWAESVSGKVTDPQGGVIPGAQVRLYVRDSGDRSNATTDAGGQYQFESQHFC